MNGFDKEKTTILTERANYCYKVMPFGLKNAWATYQRLMERIFGEQIGRAIEVYVDDMIVKSDSTEQHATELADSDSTTCDSTQKNVCSREGKKNFWASC